MPVAYIDIPVGLSIDRKRRLVQEVSLSVHAAYPIPDTRVFLREWSAEQISVDGALGSGMRPICDFKVPPGLGLEARRRLVSEVSRAIARACELTAEDVPLPSGKVVRTQWVLAFFDEYPLDRAALDEQLALENPMVLESMEGAP
jgi:hypothetical protein